MECFTTAKKEHFSDTTMLRSSCGPNVGRCPTVSVTYAKPERNQTLHSDDIRPRLIA